MADTNTAGETGQQSQPGTQGALPQELSWIYVGKLTPKAYEAFSEQERARLSKWIRKNPARRGVNL